MFNKFLLLAIIISFTLTGCYTQIAEDTPDDILYENTHTTAVPYGVGDKVDLSDDDSGYDGYYVGSDTTVYTDSTGDIIVIDNYYERMQYIESLGYTIPESKKVLVGYFPPTTYYVDTYYPSWSFNYSFGWGSSWCGYWGGWSYPVYGYWGWDYYYPTYVYTNWGYHPGYWDGGYYTPSPYKYRRDYDGNARNRGRGYATRGNVDRNRPSSSYDRSNSRNSSVASRGDSRGSSRADEILSRLPRAGRDGGSVGRASATTSRASQNRIADSRGSRLDAETAKNIRNNPRYRDNGNIKSNSREAALINARNRRLAEMGKSSSDNINDKKSNRGITTYNGRSSSRNVSGRTATNRSTPKSLTPTRSYSKPSSPSSSWSRSSSNSGSYNSSGNSSSSNSSSYSRPSSSNSSRSYSSPSRSSSSSRSSGTSSSSRSSNGGGRRR